MVIGKEGATLRNLYCKLPWGFQIQHYCSYKGFIFNFTCFVNIQPNGDDRRDCVNTWRWVGLLPQRVERKIGLDSLVSFVFM